MRLVRSHGQMRLGEISSPSSLGRGDGHTYNGQLIDGRK